MRALDWIARTLMLALAGFATLALIGSLASVSDSALGDAFPGRVMPMPEATAPPQGEPDVLLDPDRIRREAAAEATRRATVVPVTTPAEREVVRWLKALTYAVIALAVFVAAGVVALARIAHTQARR